MDTNMFFVWWIILAGEVLGISLSGHNTPPLLKLQRNWKISENEEVGTKIETVEATDAENDRVTFGLKPSLYLDGSKFFRIDSITGDVFLKESLQRKSGSQFYVLVTGNDTNYESKTEVMVEVIPPSSRTRRPPARHVLHTHVTVPLPEAIPHAITRRPKFTYPPLDDVQRNHIFDDFSIQVNASDEKSSQPEMNVLESVEGDQQRAPLVEPSIMAAVVPVVTLLALIPLVGVGVWWVRRSLVLKHGSSVVEDKKPTENSSSTCTPGLTEGEVLSNTLSRAESNKYETTNWGNTTRPQDDVKEPLKASKWEFPRHHLKIYGILGEGCFGQVWKCETENISGLPGTITVAVKMLKEHAGEREKQDLISELEVMKMLDPHPNIVRLYGCCTDKDPLYVIMEYVPHGKLQTYLRNSRAHHYYGNLHGRSNHLTSSDLTSFAFHVARGMEYLSSKGIIHRDLAARNVLVGHNKTCKVADFGFARDVIDNQVYERKSEGRLPIRWMAPESLYDNIFSSKTDVWSFGVLLWEIVTLGSTPYPGMAAGDVIKKIRDGYRLEKPEHCKRELYNIMYYCWDKDPNERPNFHELSHTLEKFLLEDIEYIELENFPEHGYYNVTNLSGEKL